LLNCSECGRDHRSDGEDNLREEREEERVWNCSDGTSRGTDEAAVGRAGGGRRRGSRLPPAAAAGHRARRKRHKEGH